MKLNSKEFEILIPAGEIAEIVTGLAAQVNENFKDKNPFFIVMLNGAFMFAADFLRHITISNEVHFMHYTSYDGMGSTGDVKKYTSVPEKVKGRHVIILEDIVDTGKTMESLISEINLYSPASTSIVSFLVKPEALQQKITIDYAGKKIKNRFVVGYGLDFDGFGRNLGDVYVVVE
jgi:hypoxanthine phosphoribosyltransferase